MTDPIRQPAGLDVEPPEEGLLAEEIRPSVVEVAYDAVEAARLTGQPAKSAAMAIIANVLEDELRNP